MPDLSKVTGILPDLADYLVYGAIAVVTLIGLFKCLLPLWKTTSSLRRAISRLQAEAGQTTDKPVWQTAGFVGKRLRGTWLRFLQNAEQLDRRGLPTNVEDYINDDTVTHGPGNATLAELIPNLLTSSVFWEPSWVFPGVCLPELFRLCPVGRRHSEFVGRHAFRLRHLRGRHQLQHCLQHAEPDLPGIQLPGH